MDPEVIGYVDGFDDGTLTGWAARRGDPQPVTVEVSVNGKALGRVCARLYREDLRSAGIAGGRHGFAFAVPDEVRLQREYVLDVRELATRTPLGQSPFTVREDDDHPLRGGAQLRRFLSAQYLSGDGLEIGALHRPLPLPPHARVRYADAFTTAQLARVWSPEVDGHDIVPVDIVTDATMLSAVDDGRFDFVVASHVVEHLEDPIRSVLNLLRVIRRGGIVFLAIPDRRHTFDVKRSPTPVEHVMRDYCGGPSWSRRAHYVEWVSVVEGLSGETAEQRVAKLESEQYPIHFHVWQPPEFTAFLAGVQIVSGIRFEIDLYKANPPEGIWILRRS